MLFIIKSDDAYKLAGISDAAGRPSERPALARVQFTVKIADGSVRLTAAATDSFLLAERTLTFNEDNVDFDADAPLDEQFIKEGTCVDAADFKKLMKDNAKGAQFVQILFEINRDGITVCRDEKAGVETYLPARNDVAKFPNYHTLWGEDIRHTASLDETTTFPAFDPVKLAQIAKFVSAKPADRNIPMVMGATKTKDADLGPWTFTAYNKKKGVHQDELRVLVMPYRLDDDDRKWKTRAA